MGNSHIKDNEFEIFTIYNEAIEFYKSQLALVDCIEDQGQDSIFYESIVLQYATYVVEFLESIFILENRRNFVASTFVLRSLYEYFVTLEYINDVNIQNRIAVRMIIQVSLSFDNENSFALS